MNFKNKFDDMIDLIEANIKKNNSDILRLVRDNFAFGEPAKLAHAFEYITGLRLKEYILRRKLIRILDFKKEENNAGRKCSIEDAVSHFEYSSEFNYMRDFKKCFGMTVSKMSENEFLLMCPPLYIDNLFKLGEDYMPIEKKIFDLPKTQFERVKKAIELTEFYELESGESEFAYQLAKELDYDIDDIFSFCFDYFDHINWVRKRYNDVHLENLAILCIETGVSVCQGLEMVKEIENFSIVEKYKDLPKEVWKIIRDDSFDFDYEANPSLAISIVQEMLERGIPLNKTHELFEFIDSDWHECIDDSIDEYLGVGIEDDEFLDDEFLDNEQNTYLDKIAREYNDIAATYSDDFLGYCSSAFSSVIDDFDEDD